MVPAEGFHFAHCLSSSETAIIDTASVLAASPGYPQVTDLLKALSEICERIIAYDGTRLAMDAGLIQTLNVVMLSTLARLPPLTTIEDVVAERIQKKALDANIRAFKLVQRVFDS
jgi:Pyruvate/2-oxoacid:ferredoxin oxidoreductase gamma subunit